VTSRPGWRTVLKRAVGYGWILFPAALLLKLTPGQVLAGLLIVAWLLRRRRSRRNAGSSGARRRGDPFFPPGLKWPLTAFYGWIAVSTLIASNQGVSPADAFSKWLYPLLLLPAFSWSAGIGASRRRSAGPEPASGSIRISLWIFLILLLVMIICHLLAMRPEDFLTGRFSGGKPNLTTNIMMVLMIFTALTFNTRGIPAVVYSLACMVLITVLFLIFQRGPFLGAAAGLSLLVARRRPVLVAIGLAIVIGFFATFPESRPVTRTRSIFAPSESTSLRERLALWKSGMRMIRDRPLVGFAGRRNFMRFYEIKYREPWTRVIETPGHVHNSIIHSAVLFGVPGLGLFLWWITILFQKAWSRWRCAGLYRDPVTASLALALLPMLVAMAVNSQFDLAVAESQRAMMFYALTGLILGATTTVGKNRRQP